MHFPITDSHLHLWDEKNLNYPWLQHAPALKRSFLLSDLLDATKSLHIESFIFVQSRCDASQSLIEASWVNELANRDSRIHGIIAHAPLELGDEVKTHLQALKNMQRVKGIRRSLLEEPDDFFLQPKFINGLQLLEEFNFSFDVCVNPEQLPAVIKMIERCSGIKFILNHLGRPAVTNKKEQTWQENMTALAAFPNVWCKMSGLVREEHHQTWRADDLKPYIFHVIKEFGFDRVMFGSDWPVVNLASSYSHWTHTLHDLLIHQNASEEEIKKLFYENAKRCYGLNSEG